MPFKPGHMGKPPALTEAQARYIKKAAELRLRLTNKALAIKFGIGVTTVSGYIHSRHKKIRPPTVKRRVIRLSGQSPQL